MGWGAGFGADGGGGTTLSAALFAATNSSTSFNIRGGFMAKKAHLVVNVWLTAATVLYGYPNASTAQALNTSAPWGVAEVNAYVAANTTVRPSDSQDPFAAQLIPVAPNSDIVLRLPVKRLDADTLMETNWHYDSDTQKLTLTGWQNIHRTLWWDKKDATSPSIPVGELFEGFATSREVERQAGGTAQNSFGAKVEIVRANETIRGIMTRSRRSVVGSLNFTKVIEPSAARALVENLEFVVVAKSLPWRPGDWVQCGTLFSVATFSNPTETTTSECYLNTEIVAIGFIDKRDGSVLIEWSRTRR